MQIYNKEEAILRINRLAKKRKKFICIINYAQNNSYIEETEKINPEEFLYKFNENTNYPESKNTIKEYSWTPLPVTFEDYSKSFKVVSQNIMAGNSFLTNLTCCTPVKTDIKFKDIFTEAPAPYKIWIKNHFICFSPEIFIQIKGDTIHSYPMKGTIEASLPDAQKQLMENPKEAAEHATITDLVRNDLNIVAKNVSVKRYRYIDEIDTNNGKILQTSSEITGTLPRDFHNYLGNILFSLLPAGSVTGAPKKKTVEIISAAETYERGFYSGVAGYFDGKNFDSAVMIRFIEEKDGKYYFKSGGGITARSDARSEYNEMIQKIYVPVYRNN